MNHVHSQSDKKYDGRRKRKIHVQRCTIYSVFPYLENESEICLVYYIVDWMKVLFEFRVRRKTQDRTWKTDQNVVQTHRPNASVTSASVSGFHFSFMFCWQFPLFSHVGVDRTVFHFSTTMSSHFSRRSTNKRSQKNLGLIAVTFIDHVPIEILGYPIEVIIYEILQ